MLLWSEPLHVAAEAHAEDRRVDVSNIDIKPLHRWSLDGCTDRCLLPCRQAWSSVRIPALERHGSMAADGHRAGRSVAVWQPRRTGHFHRCAFSSISPRPYRSFSSLGIAAGNTLEAVVGAFLVNRYCKRTRCVQPGPGHRVVFGARGRRQHIDQCNDWRNEPAAYRLRRGGPIRRDLADVVAGRCRGSSDRYAAAVALGNDTRPRAAASATRRINTASDDGGRRRCVGIPSFGTQSLSAAVPLHTSADMGCISLWAEGSRNRSRDPVSSSRYGQRSAAAVRS